MSDLIGINITKGQGISQAIQEKLGGKAAITHKENWNSVMELVKQEQADNGKKVYDTSSDEDISKIYDKSANKSNFVVHEGLMVIAQSVWNKIVELLTGKAPEQQEAEDVLVDKNPPAKDANPPAKENPPAKDETPPVKDENPPKESIRDKNDRDIKFVLDDGSYVEYEYDADGNKTKEINRNADGSVSKYSENEYNANGYITKSIYRNADGSVKEYYENEYDTNGKCTKSIHRNADGSVKEYTEYEYDTDGEQTKEITRNADGSVKEYTNCETHSSGEYIHRDADGKIIMKDEEE